MSVTTLLDILAGVFLVGGAALTLIAAVGVFRFEDVLTRIHAATKPQSLGILLIVVALALRLREPAVYGMLLVVAFFQLLTAPVAAHMVSRAAYRRGQVAWHLLVDDELTASRPRPERE